MPFTPPTHPSTSSPASRRSRRAALFLVGAGFVAPLGIQACTSASGPPDLGLGVNAAFDQSSPGIDANGGDTGPGADTSVPADAAHADTGSTDGSPADTGSAADAADAEADARDAAVDADASAPDAADANAPDAADASVPDAADAHAPDASDAATPVIFLGGNPSAAGAVFAFDGTGNILTQMSVGSSVDGFGVDSVGNAYVFSVLNPSATVNNCIEVIAPYSGHGAPNITRLIQGSTTMLSGVSSGIVVTPAGDVYTATQTGAILHFGPAADGDVAPDVLNPQYTGTDPWNQPWGPLGVGPGVLYVASEYGVGAFSATATGTVAPSRIIQQPPANPDGGVPYIVDPGWMACDPAGNLFVPEVGSNNLLIFPSTANGITTPTILSGVISGSDQIAVDSQSNVYIVNNGLIRYTMEGVPTTILSSASPYLLTYVATTL